MAGLLDFIRDEQARRDMLANLRNMAQSASNTIAGNITGPVDVAAWGLNRLGVPVGDTPVGGSEWARRRGLLGDVKPGASAFVGETLGLLSPILAAEKAPQIAGGLLKLSDNAMEPRQLNRQTGAVLLPDQYRGSHTAPMKDKGNAPLHDLTQTYPDDIYSARAAEYYGHYGGGDPLDRQSVALMQSAKGRPNMTVTMYRAVPYEKTIKQQIAEVDKQLANYLKTGKVPSDAALTGSDWYENASRIKDNLIAKAATQETGQALKINNGDWVTLSRAYAKEHGEGALNGNYKILSQKVPARKLFTDGNSIHEFGYDESGKVALDLLNSIGAGAAAGLGLNYLYSGDRP